MNAEEVVQKIYSEANAEAERILSEAESKVAAEEAELNSRLADYRKESESLAVSAAEEKMSRMLASGRMELRKEELFVRQGLLDEVFEKASERLIALDDDAYSKLMESLLVKAVETGSEEVVVGKNESRLDAGFVKRVNRNLGPGFRGNLQFVSNKANISGGFILRRGKVQTNVSVEVLIFQAREALELEISAELFE